MEQDEEPKVWVTFIKLVAGAVVLIGGVTPTDSWGIVNDSPVRNKR